MVAEVRDERLQSYLALVAVAFDGELEGVVDARLDEAGFGACFDRGDLVFDARVDVGELLWMRSRSWAPVSTTSRASSRWCSRRRRSRG